MTDYKCDFCANQLTRQAKDYNFIQQIDCPQCGKYHITKEDIPSINEPNLHLVSREIRKDFETTKRPVEVDAAYIKQATTLPDIPLIEKIDTLLLAYANDLNDYKEDIDVSDKKYIAIIGAKSEKEYQFVYSDALVSKGYLYKRTSQIFRITVEGWIYVEGLRKRTNYTQGFVAMWFDESMNTIYDNAIKLAIAQAGFQPLRIDQKLHNEKIDDQIIAEIQRSKFVIADFTGHRGGVYFEAGYALGRGIPVIWCCKEDGMEKLHFDIRQYNTINWKNEDDLKERLYQRIRATIVGR